MQQIANVLPKATQVQADTSKQVAKPDKVKTRKLVQKVQTAKQASNRTIQANQIDHAGARVLNKKPAFGSKESIMLDIASHSRYSRCGYGSVENGRIVYSFMAVKRDNLR